ncbi:MAG: phospholipid carrier-dependent glycosyltransferase [Lentisphaerae bacterium]|nr:phospholipid carrier-dependent glycosyltransferase [Lentisphaerota bacterium]
MKKTLCIFLFLAAALYLTPAFFRPLAAPEEFRYAEMAREMLVGGNYVTPTLLGGRLFEMPPMASWLTAASFNIFGFNGFAARFFSLAGALGSALLLYLWGRRQTLSQASSCNSAFLYLSSTVIVAAGSMAAPEMIWGFFLTGALVSFGIAAESRSPAERFFFLAGAGIAMGCGFLTKGFLGFALPLLAVCTWLLSGKRWKEFLYLPWLPLAAALLVAAPWALAIHKAEPDFWHQFAIYGEWRRFTTVASFPYWLRLALLAAGLFPGIFPVLAGVFHLSPEAWREFRQSQTVRLSFCFLALPVLLLLLPWGDPVSCLYACIAPAAMLGALLLDKADSNKLFASLRKNTTVFACLFILAGAAVLLSELLYLLGGTGIVSVLPLKVAVWAPFLTTAALGMVVSGTILFVNRKSKLPEPESFFTLFPIVAAVCVVFFPGFTAHSKLPEYELLDIASQLSAEKIRHPRLLAAPELMHAAAWSFKDNTVQIINTPDELEYGHRYALSRGERPLMLTYEQISALVNNSGRKEGILLLMRKDNLYKLPEKLLTTGKTFSTAGAISAIYYPGKEDKKTEK